MALKLLLALLAAISLWEGFELLWRPEDAVRDNARLIRNWGFFSAVKEGDVKAARWIVSPVGICIGIIAIILIFR